MLPNINPSTIVPPSPRRHAHFAVPIEKINIHQNFLSIISNPMTIHSSFDLDDKPLIRVVNKESEDPDDTVICLERPRLVIRKNSLLDRREISIPNNREMPRFHTRVDIIEERPCKKLRTDLSYIKSDHMQSFPTADVYEPTDNDLKFLFELNHEIFNGCQNSSSIAKITPEQFETLIVAWEHQTADNDPISLDHALAAEDPSSSLGNNLLMDQPILIRNEALTKIYNYWKELRDQYKRPLLRRYLKATNKDFTNPNIAFLRRKENKFARRRSQRTSSPLDDLKRMKNLKKNIQRSSLLLANVKYREMLKLEMHETKNKFFEEQIKEQLGEDFSLFEMTIPTKEYITGTDKYKEDKRKMEECSKMGEVVVRSINNMRKDSFKIDMLPEAKRKLSITQASTSSISTTSSTTPSYKPMSLGLSKMTSTFPKTVQGSFVMPIKKSSIALNDLKVRLRQSLGELYLKSQDEYKVKVELRGPNIKTDDDTGDKENQNNSNLQKKVVRETPHEELRIRLELEEHSEKNEAGKLIQKTTVKYSIDFDGNSTSVYSQPFAFENAKNQNQQNMTPQSQVVSNAKAKS